MGKIKQYPDPATPRPITGTVTPFKFPSPHTQRGTNSGGSPNMGGHPSDGSMGEGLRDTLQTQESHRLGVWDTLRDAREEHFWVAQGLL